jgi:adenylyltransferase/sulfurtransferase
MGVLAPLTGVVGAAQAIETIKLLLGIGGAQKSRVQNIDAKSGEWRNARVPRDPACAVCGARPASSAAGR